MISRMDVPYWRLSAYYFLFFGSIGIYAPYWPLYLQSINFTAAQIGIISATVIGTRIIAVYLWGWVVDHTGQYLRIIQITSFCAVLIFAAVLPIKDFWLLTGIMFLFSLFWGASLPQVEAMTLSCLGQSSNYYTTIRLWGSVGFIVISCLVMVFGQNVISYIPLLMLASLFMVWLFTLALPPYNVTNQHQPQISLRQVLSQKKVIVILLCSFLMLISHGPYYTFYSIHLQDYGYSKPLIGLMWSLGVVAEVILFLFIHRLLNFVGLRRLLSASLFLASVRWFLIACFTDNLPLLVTAQLLHAATFGIWHAVSIQYIHRYFTGALQARGQALYNSTSFGAGFALGSLSAGYAWESLGATSCFAIASAIALVAMVIAWILAED